MHIKNILGQLNALAGQFYTADRLAAEGSAAHSSPPPDAPTPHPTTSRPPHPATGDGTVCALAGERTDDGDGAGDRSGCGAVTAADMSASVTAAGVSDSVSGAMTGEDPSAADVRELEFSPTRGNVVFASAQHGWAFDLSMFARLYAQKLGVRQKLLQVRGQGEGGGAGEGQ